MQYFYLLFWNDYCICCPVRKRSVITRLYHKGRKKVERAIDIRTLVSLKNDMKAMKQYLLTQR